MEMTVNDVLKKLDKIDWCIGALEKGSGDVKNRYYIGQVHLEDTIDLLKEYHDVILKTKIDI